MIRRTRPPNCMVNYYSGITTIGTCARGLTSSGGPRSRPQPPRGESGSATLIVSKEETPTESQAASAEPDEEEPDEDPDSKVPGRHRCSRPSARGDRVLRCSQENRSDRCEGQHPSECCIAQKIPVTAPIKLATSGRVARTILILPRKSTYPTGDGMRSAGARLHRRASPHRTAATGGEPVAAETLTIGCRDKQSGPPWGGPL